MSGMTHSTYSSNPGGIYANNTISIPHAFYFDAHTHLGSSDDERAFKHKYQPNQYSLKNSLEDEVSNDYDGDLHPKQTRYDGAQEMVKASKRRPKAPLHPIFAQMGGGQVQITHASQGGLERILGKVAGKGPSILSDYKGQEMLRNAYHHFRSTPEGQRHAEAVGKRAPDGYAIVDTGGSAKAVTMYTNDGRVLLGWDKRYLHVLQDPQRYQKEFNEIMGHEQTHIAGDLSEVSTHRRNGDHWAREAQMTNDPYKRQAYHEIAHREHKMSELYKQGHIHNPFGGRYEGPGSSPIPQYQSPMSGSSTPPLYNGGMGLASSGPAYQPPMLSSGPGSYNCGSSGSCAKYN